MNKPVCEANCGKRTKVWGTMYCTDCHIKYAGANEFRPASQIPPARFEGRHFIALNPCDGYHVVVAEYDNGNFEYFRGFADVDPLPDGFYIAWKVLPEANELIEVFKGQLLCS